MPTCRILLVGDSPAFLAAATALLDASGWIEVVVRALIRPPELPSDRNRALVREPKPW